MRILVLTDLYPPVSIGGYEMRCKETVEEMRRLGHTVTVLTGRYKEKTAPDEPDVFRQLIPYTLVNPFADLDFPDPLELAKRRYQIEWMLAGRKNYRTTRDLIGGCRPQVVFVWNMHSTGVASILAAQDLGIPTVYNLGEYWLLELKQNLTADISPFKRRFRAVLAGLSDFGRLDLRRLIVISQALKQKYVDAGFPAETIQVVPRGVPPQIIRDAAELQSIYPLPDKPVRLLFVGRIVPEKGPDTAILAVARLVNEFGLKAMVLDLAGSGSEAYIAELKALAARLGIAEQVHFLGWVEREDLLRSYPDYTALLFPSRWEEPLGGTVLEAMARGLPVIATRTGGLPETISDGRTGLLIPIDDPAALASAVQRLLAEDGLWQRIRLTALECIREEHTQERVTGRILAMLEAAAGAG